MVITFGLDSLPTSCFPQLIKLRLNFCDQSSGHQRFAARMISSCLCLVLCFRSPDSEYAVSEASNPVFPFFGLETDEQT